jgi:transposase
MRGKNIDQTNMLCLISPESRVPANHPLRMIKKVADTCLRRLSPVFDAMYGNTGRPSIPPERLLKASLLMALYSVRSERQFCEQLDYNLLFRWFLDMDMTEPAFDHSTFSQRNRDRLLEHDVARKFFQEVVHEARRAHLLSSEHFTVDGTLIEAWASLKTFRPKNESGDKDGPDDPGNPTVDFHGERRSNDTHESKTDPEARLARKGKGKEAKLCYAEHALMENRNGLLVDLMITQPNKNCEPKAALVMLDRSTGIGGRRTVGADKGYDQYGFVDSCREIGFVPHVAAKKRGSALDWRTKGTAAYKVSQRIRKRVEEIFGWKKTVGVFRRTRFKGRDRTEMAALIVGAAYNLLRIGKLVAQPT